ncbi:unnamed protein product [Leptidea sinapis]
MAMDL